MLSAKRKENRKMTTNETKIVNQIKNQYITREQTELERLKELHKRVNRGPKVFAYIFGIIASLILGVGMCLAMEIITTGTYFMVLGIIVGLIGILLASINYLIYSKMIKSAKAKHASEIISLSNEILNND